MRRSKGRYPRTYIASVWHTRSHPSGIPYQRPPTAPEHPLSLSLSSDCEPGHPSTQIPDIWRDTLGNHLLAVDRAGQRARLTEELPKVHQLTHRRSRTILSTSSDTRHALYPRGCGVRKPVAHTPGIPSMFLVLVPTIFEHLP